ncbi:hypothetical protein D3C87_1775680 [compost metagenome]
MADGASDSGNGAEDEEREDCSNIDRNPARGSGHDANRICPGKQAYLCAQG